MFAGWGVAGETKSLSCDVVSAPVAAIELTASRIVEGVCRSGDCRRGGVLFSLAGMFFSANSPQFIPAMQEPERHKIMDKDKIRAAVRLFLEGIGENPEREGLLETPDRVARMCEEIYSGDVTAAGEHLLKQFDAPDSELVVEKDIVFYSSCEHHLLPFFGKAHIAYIPSGKVVGLSKLARLVDTLAKQAQIQERLTVQIADAIEQYLSPLGIMVIIEAEHTCMTMRGVKKPGSKTVTTETRGEFHGNYEKQRLLLEMVRG